MVFNPLTYLSTPLGIYFMWICLHFITPHLYTYFCTSMSTYGFLISPFLAPTPHCSAFRWIIYTGGNMITTMWVVIGGWLIQKVLIKKTELPTVA